MKTVLLLIRLSVRKWNVILKRLILILWISVWWQGSFLSSCEIFCLNEKYIIDSKFKFHLSITHPVVAQHSATCHHHAKNIHPSYRISKNKKRNRDDEDSFGCASNCVSEWSYKWKHGERKNVLQPVKHSIHEKKWNHAIVKVRLKRKIINHQIWKHSSNSHDGRMFQHAKHVGIYPHWQEKKEGQTS